MFADPTFWVAVALVIFLAIVVRVGGHKQLLSAIDSRAEKVTKELAEAKSLREEAQRLLAEYQRKQKDAQAEAEQIVAAAKAEAERLRTESVAKMNEFVARRGRLAEQKIAQAEAQAIAEVRATAADVAVSAARTILTDAMKSGGSADITGAAIREISAKLN
jgi:F-type H+-transporting ATPase subunit b